MSTPKLIDVTPFEPLIIKAHYDYFNFKKLEPACNRLISGIERKTHLEKGNANSSATNVNIQPHIMPEFKEFYNWLNPIASHILYNEYGLFDKIEYKISNSWVNFHGEGGETAIHHHGDTALTVAAYLQLPEDGGFIQFKDPMEYQKGFHIRKYDDEFWMWKTVPATTGDVILFPGWIRHRTQPNKNKNTKRWVLTTNYMHLYKELK
jgi:uncharacterized protein (TIGR02466 family)